MKTDRWLLALTTSTLSSGIAGLLVPLYIVRLGGGAAQLGLSAALSSLVGAPGAILAGRYADRTGNRRRVVLLALGGSALALSVLPLLQSVPVVIVINAALAFAIAAIAPVVTMLIVDDAPESAWNTRIARLNQFQGYGTTLGFVVGTAWLVGAGGILSTAAMQGVLFGLAALFGAVAAVLAALWLPQRAPPTVGPRRSDRVATILTRTSRNVRDATFSFGLARFFWSFKSLSRRPIRSIGGDLPRALLAYFLAAFVFFTGFAVFWAPLPLFLTDAEFTSGTIFGIYLLNNVGSTALFGTAGRLCDRYDIRLLQGSALGLRALCFLVIGLLGIGSIGLLSVGRPSALAVVAVILSLVGVTWAFIAVTGTAIVSRLAPPHVRGGILGIYGALSAVAGALGSLLGGWLASYGFDYAFLASVGLVLAGGAMVAIARQLSMTRSPLAEISD